jgi:hypothetical protein
MLNRDFERLENYNTEYIPAERSEFLERDNLQSWLQDDSVRDQFCLRFADETQVFVVSVHAFFHFLLFFRLHGMIRS